YKYFENRLVEIRYSEQSWKTFQYDLKGNLLLKVIFQNEKMKEYFNYQYSEDKTIVYQHCRMDGKGNHLFCEVTEGHYDDEGRLFKIVQTIDEDSLDILIW